MEEKYFVAMENNQRFKPKYKMKKNMPRLLNSGMESFTSALDNVKNFIMT